MLDVGDKVVLFKAGNGGYLLFDRITDVINISTPDEPITSLQPTPGSPAPGTPGGETIPVTPEGELPRFRRINAPTNVRVTDITFQDGIVRWDYTRSTDPLVPIETGFEIVIRREYDNTIAQRVFAGSTDRTMEVGGWFPANIYTAEVRAITTIEQAPSIYNEAQFRYILSAQGFSLPSLFSPWAISPRFQTDDAPVNPVFPPNNVRIGSNRGVTSLTGFWDYNPLPGAATATGFQVKFCKNSLGTISCSQVNVTSDTRRRTFTTLDDNENYWLFVRTVASGGRVSRWVSAGPPRRTLRDWRPTIRNLTLTRAGSTRNVRWSGEVANATEIKASLRFQPFRIVNGVETEFEAPLRINGTWQPLQGTPDRQGFITIPPQTEANLYAGRGTLTLILEARNSRASRTASVALQVRQLPLLFRRTIRPYR